MFVVVSWRLFYDRETTRCELAVLCDGVEVEGKVSKEIHSCDTASVACYRDAASAALPGPDSLSTSLRDHDAVRRLCHSLRSHYFCSDRLTIAPVDYITLALPPCIFTLSSDSCSAFRYGRY